MRRESVGRWSWFLTAVVISVLGLAGCGGGGGGGGGGGVVPVSPFTRVGGNNNSGDLGAALSQTGRFVAFSSLASDLTGTGNDNNSSSDIFVYDRQTADTTVASRISGTFSLKAANADDSSFFPAISADGSKVAFESRANNLVGPADPANAFSDIFVHDRTLNTMARVSVALGGAPTNGDSNKPSISGDGNFVAFHSLATNLAAGDNNGVSDVYLANISGLPSTPTITRISGTAGGLVFGHSVSDNGARVVFQSPPVPTGGNIFVWTSGAVTQLTTDGTSRISGISGNGRFVVFDSDAALVAGDNNGVSDVYVHDLTGGTTTRVSVSSTGAQATGGGSFALGHKAISDDGNLVVFESDATNLGGTGSTSFYVRDRAAGTTTALAGISGTFVSTGVTISGDGLVAGFVTDDSGIVSGDTGGLFDVFLMAVP
jgi:Tol biopolymer transport system component